MNVTKDKWLAIRKEAALNSDPATAELVWCFHYIFDPYGIDPEPPEEYRIVGREYFARFPGSDIWVWFGDLPFAVAKALCEKRETHLAFPAGLRPVKDDDARVGFRDANGNYVVEITESIKQAAAKGAEQMAKLGKQIANGYIRDTDNAKP
jgi:hypothetical protein